jgi:mannose-6-phosphate isomerase-like protein (cupin superfamily)
MGDLGAGVGSALMPRAAAADTIASSTQPKAMMPPTTPTTASKSVVVLDPDSGERAIDIAGADVTILASSEHTAGTISVLRYTAPAHFPGPPLHIHPRFDEAWYVLDGELTLMPHGEASTLSAGAFAFTPGDVPHTFANRTDEPTTFLVICTPGGFEGYFRELAELSTGGPPSFETIGALALEHGSSLA